MISNPTSINHPHLFNRVLGCAVVLVGGVFFHAKADAQLAQAQSLQLYGLLDVGYVHVSGLKDGTFNGVSSGVMEGSRWGIKGLEDLGGGYKAVFTLESRLEIDTGTMSNTPYSGGQLPDRIATAAGLGLMSPNPSVNAMYQAATAAIGMQLGSTLGANLQSRLFDRQSMAGLITPHGAFLMGRQYTPAYEVSATFDTMQGQSALASGQIAAIPATVDIRLGNTIQYRVQKNELSASVMLGLGETVRGISANKFAGTMAVYKSEKFSFGLGFNARKNEMGQKSLQTTSFGFSALLGPGTVSSLYQMAEDKNPTGLSSVSQSLAHAGFPVALIPVIQSAYDEAFKQKNRLFNLGYKLNFNKNTLYVSYSKFNDKTAANADAASLGFALTHALSKRTDLNFVLAKTVNSNRGQVVVGGGGYLGGVARTAGVNSTALHIALRHRF